MQGDLYMKTFVAPKYYTSAFNCPYCGAYSNIIWVDIMQCGSYTSLPYPNSKLARCSCCGKYMLWVNGEMIVPTNSIAPMPHNDMPENVKVIYFEAREIVGKSPRGASALLRLALQLLCDNLVEGNYNINDKIGKLVEKGLPKTLQKAFDLVRIVGNNAVHPGQINIDDNPEIAYKLFDLLNIIVEKMIAEPNEIASFYSSTVPENLKAAIEKRDREV